MPQRGEWQPGMTQDNHELISVGLYDRPLFEFR